MDSKCQDFSCTWVVDGCFISVLGRPSFYFYLNIILASDCLLFSVSGHSMSYVVTCTFWLDLLGGVLFSGSFRVYICTSLIIAVIFPCCHFKLLLLLLLLILLLSYV